MPDSAKIRHLEHLFWSNPREFFASVMKKPTFRTIFGRLLHPCNLFRLFRFRTIIFAFRTIRPMFWPYLVGRKYMLFSGNLFRVLLSMQAKLVYFSDKLSSFSVFRSFFGLTFFKSRICVIFAYSFIYDTKNVVFGKNLLKFNIKSGSVFLACAYVRTLF